MSCHKDITGKFAIEEQIKADASFWNSFLYRYLADECKILSTYALGTVADPDQAFGRGNQMGAKKRLLLINKSPRLSATIVEYKKSGYCFLTEYHTKMVYRF